MSVLAKRTGRAFPMGRLIVFGQGGQGVRGEQRRDLAY